MTHRVQPPPDPYASCPGDGPILPFFKGHFQAAFVALHQFLRPVSSAALGEATRLESSYSEIVATHSPVSWTEVLAATGFDGIADLDLALRTSISGLKAQYERRDLAERLATTMRVQGLETPLEGEPCPFVQGKLLSGLHSDGHRWVWIGDEFCSERKLHWLEEVQATPSPFPHPCLFTPDKRFLITSHWDSHYTLFCGPEVDLVRLCAARGVEGFLCEPTTEVFWSLHGPTPPRIPPFIASLSQGSVL